jgi:hypothetical protein
LNDDKPFEKLVASANPSSLSNAYGRWAKIEKSKD